MALYGILEIFRDQGDQMVDQKKSTKSLSVYPSWPLFGDLNEKVEVKMSKKVPWNFTLNELLMSNIDKKREGNLPRKVFYLIYEKKNFFWSAEISEGPKFFSAKKVPKKFFLPKSQIWNSLYFLCTFYPFMIPQGCLDIYLNFWNLKYFGPEISADRQNCP